MLTLSNQAKMRADFYHGGVSHTKSQPLRLKDAEDIGWFIRNARLSRGFHHTALLKTHLQTMQRVSENRKNASKSLVSDLQLRFVEAVQAAGVFYCVPKAWENMRFMWIYI